MRKLLSIPMILVILLTGLTVNLASHYCGGIFITSEISFSGVLATCGMEHTTHEKPGFNEADHTCQDFTSSYTFSGNYVPSSFINNFLSNSDSAVLCIMVLNPVHETGDIHIVSKPPGVFNPSGVQLEVISIFRI